MKKILLLVAVIMLVAAPAKAVTLGGQNWTDGGVILTLTPTVPGGNQPQNTPCVICGENQPQQPSGFGYTDFHNTGGMNNILFFSTNIDGGGNPGADTVGIGYDGSFLRAFLLANGAPNLQFSIGVDINDNNHAQTLESFYLLNLTTHVVLAAFSPGPGGTEVPSQNNGTGFPDYTLTGFDINLGTDIHLGDQLIFFARISNANDGPDSFFLVASPAAVPTPIVGAGIPGMVTALAGLWVLARRRRNRLA